MFKGITDKLLDFTKRVLTSCPYDVEEINANQLSKWKLVFKEDNFSLYQDKTNFIAVLQSPNLPNAVFSLFRLPHEAEAVQLFNSFSFKLLTLSKTVGPWTKDKLQQFCNVAREHPGWQCAHIAAKLGLIKCFSDETVLQSLNAVDDELGVTPIMVAIETENMDVIKELIIRHANLGLADKHGCNVFHYAARTTNVDIIKFLAGKDRSALNQLNAYGESALHEACLNDRPILVEHLLRWNCDPMTTLSDRYPVHCAMLANSVKCLNVLCHWSRDQVHVKDKETGGTPLHWAKSRDCIYALCEYECNLEALNRDNETALMVVVKNNLYDCTLGLLAKAARADVSDGQGNSPLHKAIEVDNDDLVQALIVFGSNVNSMNNNGISPRHLAATSNLQKKDYILYFLHGAGARKCDPSMSGCALGCSADGNFNGKAKSTPVSTPEDQKKAHEGVMSDVAMAAAMTRSASASESAILLGSDTAPCSPGASGDRVLCLDGGGIRGLILIQLLLAIEQVLGQPIRNCFDWIGGTSTGGILSLAIVHGKSMRYCQGLYFQLKDAVFRGKRPYDSAPLEEFLRKEFGETTRMSERDYPRVVVTGVLADRMPAELHLFRNYDIPGQDLNVKPKTTAFAPLPRTNDQLVWRAARCSGAAPTYFRSCGRFVDGGLMANNPTLDMLTEIHEYNMALKAADQSQLSRPVHVVVSLGTGRLPQRPVNACDVYRPEGIFDLAHVVFGAKNLGELLIDQATQSEGRVVDRARAWCSAIGVPYYRFSPQLSEDIPLDCKDDKTLVNMLWETQCYITGHQDRLLQLVTLLQP